MKLKALAVACSLAFASQAFATPLTPAQVAAIPSTNSLFISGSSALQNTISQIASTLFVSGTMSVYFDTSGNGGNYRAYAGTFASGISGIPAGQNGVIFETAKGGSINGVVPVALSQNVNRIVVDATCTANGSDPIFANAPLFNCSNTTAVVPQGGVADVEPALFTNINVPTTNPATPSATAAVLANLAAAVPSIAQPMDIIVTNTATATIKAGLSKGQVASLMDAGVPDWSFIDATLAAGTPITVCRRTPGSGTQAAINAKFFGFPCSVSQLAPADHTATTEGVYNVIENSSSGALAACMAAASFGMNTGYTIDTASGAFDNGTLHPDASTSTDTAGVVHTWIHLPTGGIAIGLMGADRPAGNVKNSAIVGSVSATPGVANSGTAVSENYLPVAINGSAPTLANTSNGSYDVMVENSWNQRKAGVGTALTTVQQAMFNTMANRSGDPAVLGGSLSAPVPGVLGLTEQGYVYNAATFATYPVSRVGNFANTCTPLQQLQ